MLPEFPSMTSARSAIGKWLRRRNRCGWDRRLADDDVLEIRAFRTSDIPFPSESLPEKASPVRVLSHLFWVALPWAELERELGPPYVLDTGCGSGLYQALFEHWSGTRIAGYTGIDRIPAPACLGLYGLHGFRQYPPGVMRRITGLFDDFSRAHAFALGDARCKDLHRHFIHARPARDRRETETETYGKCLLEVLRADMDSPADDPLFYALVIHSYPRRTVFRG